ncbi:MAG: aspartate-alanine antiporter [Candidatus Margulisbacteria bacterium]|nr:aspartate-alanine antiporter [Candidatus Margulisiibacteriota bacterium]MBU1022258.1 aspartate-alanine antiporter [Candidatus Margulisiibacteriota bacterium]MBU1729303.1 aspartate-alanine antiporter [Candidatus Margulisiibacteriota bacterium]MBU1955576.1 aspartate-alanine antiporter [Candidatus Margulisiibacteriota bacterium]
MLKGFIEICRAHPEILIFLAIAIGYFVGKLKFFGFSLGSTAGVLLAALVLGQMSIEINPLLQSVSFALFLFAIGYKVGPAFFGALKKEGLHYIWISLVVAVTGLITAIVLGKIFGFDAGTTAGLLGGAMTQSAVIGTADGAILGLPISAAQKTILQNNVAVAYAISYIFGVAGLIMFYKIVPRLFGIDLKKEAAALEAKMSGAADDASRPELFSWYKSLILRGFRVANNAIVGKKISDLESMFPAKVAVEKIKRGDTLMDFDPNTVIENGDEIALAGGLKGLIQGEKIIGPEIDDQGLIDIMGEIMDVCVLNSKVVGQTLGELSQAIGHGCFLRRLKRQEHELPLTRDTEINKCDILTIVGAREDVEKYIKYLGYVERPTSTTDLIMVALGCVVGSLIGLITINVLKIPVTLGMGGGVLLVGLIFGWLRAVHPTFGQISTGAQWIFTDLGLNLFIACVGLTAGPQAVQALKTSGGAVFLAGAIITLMPTIIGYIFGRMVFKLNPVLLMGALTGAETASPALNAVKEVANSSTPALGFAVPYAFGNVILTVWGTVLIHVMW